MSEVNDEHISSQCLEVVVHKTSLTRPLFIKVSVLVQDMKVSGNAYTTVCQGNRFSPCFYICRVGVDFGTVLTMWYSLQNMTHSYIHYHLFEPTCK